MNKSYRLKGFILLEWCVVRCALVSCPCTWTFIISNRFRRNKNKSSHDDLLLSYFYKHWKTSSTDIVLSKGTFNQMFHSFQDDLSRWWGTITPGWGEGDMINSFSVLGFLVSTLTGSWTSGRYAAFPGKCITVRLAGRGLGSDPQCGPSDILWPLNETVTSCLGTELGVTSLRFASSNNATCLAGRSVCDDQGRDHAEAELMSDWHEAHRGVFGDWLDVCGVCFIGNSAKYLFNTKECSISGKFIVSCAVESLGNVFLVSWLFLSVE